MAKSPEPKPLTGTELGAMAAAEVARTDSLDDLLAEAAFLGATRQFWPPPNPPPTAGRIVHYYESSSSEPLAAIITAVFPDGVNLTVFRPAMTFASTRIIPYVDDLKADGPAWRWPQGAVPLAHHVSLADAFPGAQASVYGVPNRRV